MLLTADRVDLFKRVADLPSETVSGDLLIVDAERDLFFSSNPVGAFIWSKLEAAISLDELSDAVVETFEGAERASVKSDVLEFIDALLLQGIVETLDRVQAEE